MKVKITYPMGEVTYDEQSDCHTIEAFINTRFGTSYDPSIIVEEVNSVTDEVIVPVAEVIVPVDEVVEEVPVAEVVEEVPVAEVVEEVPVAEVVEEVPDVAL